MTDKKYINSAEAILELQHDTSFILPPIFYHTAVEKPDGTEKREYRNKLKGEENEYLVFKALQTLCKEKELVVLHSFKIKEKNLKDLSIEKNDIFGSDSQKESEHDFIVIDKKNHCFVCIEVKSSEVVENVKSGISQLCTIERLIKKVCKQKSFDIVKVLAFVEETDKGETLAAYKRQKDPTQWNRFAAKSYLSEYMSWFKTVIPQLYKNSLEKFSFWWKDNVTSVISENSGEEQQQEEFGKVTKLLIGIWLGKRNPKEISEIGMIKKIDERLREAVLYQGKKERKKVVTESVVLTELQLKSLKIHSLTSEQEDLLYSNDSNHCILRGPAGSGKTILMLAKILLLSNHHHHHHHHHHTDTFFNIFHLTPIKPIVLITHKEDSKIEKKLSELSQLKIKRLNLTDLAKKGSDFKLETINGSNVLILYYSEHSTVTEAGSDKLSELLKQLGKFHIFIDNFQHHRFLQKNVEKLLANLKANNSEEYIWILVDDMQHFDEYWLNNKENQVHKKLSSLLEAGFKEKHLTKVIRNTIEISDASIALCHNNKSNIDSLEFIKGDSFHFIHGPKPRLLIATDTIDETYVKSFAERYGSVTLLSTYKDCSLPFHEFKSLYIYDVIDDEFTSVLAVLETRVNILSYNNQSFLEQWFYRHAYAALSRARVVAEIVLIPDEQYKLDSDVIERLRQYFEVVDNRDVTSTLNVGEL